MSIALTVSIVLYKSDPEKFQEVLRSLRASTIPFKLYIIDNSPTAFLRRYVDDECIYIFNERNIGFGRAHNIAMRRATSQSKYHLILNPDVFFGPGVLERLLRQMEEDTTIGLISPRVYYPNGNIQYLCKLLPSPLDLVGRRFFSGASWARKRNLVYELRNTGYDQRMNIPFLSGCFMLLRNSILEEVGFFDERFFMYTEDADLSRRIFRKSKTLYFPEVNIYHHYEKGSYKNHRLMFYNIAAAFKYFFKWGWFFDEEREQINQSVIAKYLKPSESSRRPLPGFDTK
jgi:GT2 family glycosyltransferase